MRISFFVLLASIAAAVPAAAQEAPAPATPPASEPAPAPEPAVQPQSPAAAAQISAGRPRFALGEWLLQAHLGMGLEPHGGFRCGRGGAGSSRAASQTCHMVAFSVGGQLLWRGGIGFALGLYAANGTSLLAADEQQRALGDRVSVTAALALRPLAWMAWSRGDRFSARLLSGLALEIGPSLEYTRSTSPPPAPPCALRATAISPGLHAALSLEIPFLGDTRSGWLALRLSARAVAGRDLLIGPSPACSPLTFQPGTAGQFFAGLAYYL